MTAQVSFLKESVFVEYIPRSRHNEPACVDAKQKELRKYKKYDVFEVVDIEDDTEGQYEINWTNIALNIANLIFMLVNILV